MHFSAEALTDPTGETGDRVSGGGIISQSAMLTAFLRKIKTPRLLRLGVSILFINIKKRR